MAENQFREDLYYRLNVFPIHIPPLRDRRSDIILLADYFTEKYSKTTGKQIKQDIDTGHRASHELSLAGKRPRT